jgi:hypothetical protein
MTDEQGSFRKEGHFCAVELLAMTVPCEQPFLPVIASHAFFAWRSILDRLLKIASLKGCCAIVALAGSSQ